MDNNTNWYMEEKINRTKKSLENNNYEVYVLNSMDDIIPQLSKIIEKGSTVSVGGSMTIIDSNVLNLLRNGDYNFLDRYEEGLKPQDIQRVFRESFFADYYLTSSNAVTENGEMVNLDGNGNRVAAMIYGPRKLIVVIGENKIVKDLNEAYNRVRGYTSPINAKRLSRKTPCTLSGVCMDCSSEERICNHYVVTYRQNIKNRGIVIIVKESLGY